MLFLIHHDAFEGKEFLPCFLGLFGAAEHRADTGEQLHNAEGLGHIIVGPQVQSLYDIKFTGFGGHHDDRDVLQLAGGPDFLQNGEPVLTGKHDVQQHQVRNVLLQCFIEFRGLSEASHLVALPPKGITHQFANAFIIFYTVNKRHVKSPLKTVKAGRGFWEALIHSQNQRFPGSRHAGLIFKRP